MVNLTGFSLHQSLVSPSLSRCLVKKYVCLAMYGACLCVCMGCAAQIQCISEVLCVCVCVCECDE